MAASRHANSYMGHGFGGLHRFPESRESGRNRHVKSHVNRVFTLPLEVGVEVYSEDISLVNASRPPPRT